jgi:transcriptional regulator with XRE-family HTH domain
METMPAGEVSVALAVLRVVRGWNQDDLAKASGVRNSSVSDYERGRKVPELKTLERLVSAMGYPLSAIDQARVFIAALRSGSALFDAALLHRPPTPEASVDDPALAREGPAALQWEVEQVSAEMGRAVSRMTRVMFALAGRFGSGA